MNAVGLLKEELRRAGSLILACAEETKVPAGGALAVDREAFAALVTKRIEAHPRITVEHAVVERIPEASADHPVIIGDGAADRRRGSRETWRGRSAPSTSRGPT